MENKFFGSSLDDLLEEDGIKEEVEMIAIKRILAYQIQQEMKNKKITKTKMAELLETSRSQVNRLLDEENTSITLHTLQKAAAVLGQRLCLSLKPLSQDA